MCERREYGLLSKRSKQILGEEVPLKDEMRSGGSYLPPQFSFLSYSPSHFANKQ